MRNSMETDILRSIGLTENEVRIYLALLKTGPCTAYELSQITDIYRVHIYDKLQNLMTKGLVSQMHKGSKKLFQCGNPEKLMDYMEEKKKQFEEQQAQVQEMLPVLQKMQQLPKSDTSVNVFQGIEGIKYFLKDMIRTKKEILINGVDDLNYETYLSVFMKQYFRDLKKYKIRERVITAKHLDIFQFDKKMAPTTTYRFLEEKSLNPAHTTIYGNKVAIITWGTPPTVILIENREIAEKHRSYFEQLWEVAHEKN